MSGIGRRARCPARRDRLIAYSILVVDLLFYGATLSVAVASHSVSVGVLASFATGIAVAFLFIVGHDCCHGSFLPSKRENRIVGQVALLPSLHPFALWRIGHNLTHHRFTNLAQHDYVYRPLSRDQYLALGSWGRARYRFHRSTLGPLTYYLVEIWLPKMIFAGRSITGEHGRECARDRVLVALWVAGFALAAALLPFDAWRVLALGLVLPLVVFCVVMSVAIYLHHTNPRVPWFASEAEWDRAVAQRRCTVHVEVPGIVDLIFHRIMEHTAHHVGPGTPMYRLRDAQRALDSEAVTLRWTLSRHLEIVRACRLYDFDRHVWTDYDGALTALPGRGALPALTPACPSGSPGSAGAPRACSPS